MATKTKTKKTAAVKVKEKRQMPLSVHVPKKNAERVELEWKTHRVGANEVSWSARSSLAYNNEPMIWKITVSDTGEFLLINSDEELVNKRACEAAKPSTLRAAKATCQAWEEGLIALFEARRKEKEQQK